LQPRQQISLSSRGAKAGEAVWYEDKDFGDETMEGGSGICEASGDSGNGMEHGDFFEDC